MQPIEYSKTHTNTVATLIFIVFTELVQNVRQILSTDRAPLCQTGSGENLSIILTPEVDMALWIEPPLCHLYAG